MRLGTVAIVVVSDGNNPRILNPDFLDRNGITPGAWKVSDILVLPPISRVKYENGVEITLEEMRLSLKTFAPEQIDWKDQLPQITISFLAALPQVAYRDVGLNFDVYVDAPDIHEKGAALVERLMREGPWLRTEEKAIVSSLKLQYPLAEAVLNLTLNVSRTKDADGRETEQFYFDANFHKQLAPDETLERRNYITDLRGRYDELNRLIETFPLGRQ